jgi:hypothetical protein
MKAYRQAKKAAKAQQPQQLDIKTPAANILQNAFRNKISRNAVLKQKQDKTKSCKVHTSKPSCRCAKWRRQSPKAACADASRSISVCT